jgi:hypothetical protein
MPPRWNENRLTAKLGIDYLTELLRHAEQLQQDPAAWMPWNYPMPLENCTASRQC